MRNVPDECYEIQPLDERHVLVTDRTAFPHDLVYGFLYGICHRFAPKGSYFTVTRTYLHPETPDKDGAIYDVAW